MNKKMLILPMLLVPCLSNSLLLPIFKIKNFTSLSLSFKVIYAIKEKVRQNYFKFHNVDNFFNNNQLKFEVLPVLLKFLKKNPLIYFAEKLQYDVNRLHILGCNKHDDQELTLVCSYFSQEFQLIIPLNNTIDNNDIILTLTKYLTNLEKKDKPLMYSWNQLTDLMQKIEKWFFIGKNWQIFINAKLLKFGSKKISIVGLSFYDWKQSFEIGIIFDYEDIKGTTINLKFDNIINDLQILDLINQDIPEIQLLVDEKITYKNFWENLPLEQWVKQIKLFFDKKPLFWNQTPINVNWNINNMKIDYSMAKQPISPWAKKMVITFFLNIENNKIKLDFPIKITAPIDYEEITENFKKQIVNVKIDYKILSKDDAKNNKIIIKNLLLIYLNNFLKFNNEYYAIDFNRSLLVLDYKMIDYEKEKLIMVKISDKNINTHPFDIFLKVINFEN